MLKTKSALLLGTVSMIIVFISGIFSGVVRTGTLMLRSVLAFFITGAAIYVLMMIFDFFNPESQPANAKLEEDDETAEDMTENPLATGFQPMDMSNLPNAEK